MTNEISVKQTAEMLLAKDNILILCHKNPDGDTLGSAAGLCFALKSKGKKCAVRCNNYIPEMYNYLRIPVFNGEFTPEFIVAVDIAGRGLLGKNMEEYADRVDLNIDHHATNERFARNLCLKGNYPAAAQLMYEIICEMDVKITKHIADCLHTGILTDTGCLKYSSTTPETLITAAKLMQAGADHKGIAERFFMQKSRKKVELEKFALNNTEYYFDDRFAFLILDYTAIETIKPEVTDTDGLSSYMREVEGVDIAILLRQIREETYKVSIRTSERVNARNIALSLGGGGHIRASGAEIVGDVSYVRRKKRNCNFI